MRRDNVMEVSLFLLALEITFIVVGDAVHPGCGCLVFSSTYGKDRGTFHSPDYPKAYSPGIDCLLYSFVAGPEQIIELTFVDFDVHKGQSDCARGDYVKIFIHLDSADVNEYTPWENLMCGRLTDISPVLYSSGPGLVLEFHSGHRKSNSSGFHGYFRFIDRRSFRIDGLKLTGTMCDYQFVSSEQSPTYGKFYSPRYPSTYPKNVRCSYRFNARFKERIRVVFEEISLQRGDLSCLNRADLIRIYDGKSSSDPSIGLFCNQGTELEVLSTGSDLYVEFVANSDRPGQGFKATFQFQMAEDHGATDSQRSSRLGSYSFATQVEPNVSETRSSCDLAISSDTSKNGTISSPLYPSPYPSKTTCRYEFQGRGKERVRIVFHDFNLYQSPEDVKEKECDNQDSLVAFVHIDGRMDKLDSFCGGSLPKPVMSNGPRLKLEFQSLFASRYSRGFNATYSFTENFGISSGTQLPEYPCAFVLNSNETKSGYFHSPNYPGFYPRDTECHYFFHGNLKEKVHLHFTYFDVEGVLPCEAISASDYVEFSNFMARDRKYARHCGQLKEFDVESDRKFFRVTFRSNDRLDGTGFNATYHFMDEVEVFTQQPSTDAAVCRPGAAASCLGLALVVLAIKLST
ncbi:suppressor of lurcher protein 1 [Cylas formicarius]|uniref:suppressor of lurcher protein 1 n=1 Tax=Cylas formicarius TaxID=197179 RepID=UPI0029589A4D|nr:suppressor of lurcher protein 1 [Cylas formicarius]XP_060523820.1 suppressor of lurcher protein 1 [Cylas formicarius]XP_060523822.1 suppressor of lurcher protein 1 [Cylas formicarius]